MGVANVWWVGGCGQVTHFLSHFVFDIFLDSSQHERL